MELGPENHTIHRSSGPAYWHRNPGQSAHRPSRPLTHKEQRMQQFLALLPGYAAWRQQSPHSSRTRTEVLRTAVLRSVCDGFNMSVPAFCALCPRTARENEGCQLQNIHKTERKGEQIPKPVEALAFSRAVGMPTQDIVCLQELHGQQAVTRARRFSLRQIRGLGSLTLLVDGSLCLVERAPAWRIHCD